MSLSINPNYSFGVTRITFWCLLISQLLSGAILDLPIYLLCSSNQDAHIANTSHTSTEYCRQQKQKKQRNVAVGNLYFDEEELACFRCKLEMICRGLGASANKLC